MVALQGMLKIERSWDQKIKNAGHKLLNVYSECKQDGNASNKNKKLNKAISLKE